MGGMVEGARVRICHPDAWEFEAVVIATDLHPFGDSYVKVRSTNTPAAFEGWVDVRSVRILQPSPQQTGSSPR